MMLKIILIHGDRDVARKRIHDFLDPAWETIVLPPSVEKVYPIILKEQPDVVIFSLQFDVEYTIKLAQLVILSEKLEGTWKFYLDLTPETKQWLLDTMKGIGAVYMVRWDILKEEIQKSQ